LIAEFKAEAEERLQLVIRQKQAEERLAEERHAIEKAKAEIELEVASKLAAKLTESEKVQRERLREEIQVEIDGATTREKEALSANGRRRWMHSECGYKYPVRIASC
jgi:hypothetical protein